MRRLLGVAISLVALAVGAAPASAAPTDPFIYQSSFDGAGIGGLQNVGDVVVNRATGNLLVFEQGRIDQFDPAGNPVDFAATGSPSLQVGFNGKLVVDNSGGPTQGNIYVYVSNGAQSTFESFWAFTAAGEPLAANPQLLIEPFSGYSNSIGVDSDGKLWDFYLSFDFEGVHAGQMTTAGKAAGVDSIVPGLSFLDPSAVASDDLGNFYLSFLGQVDRFDPANGFADVGRTGLPGSVPLAVDPSTNDVYARPGSKILGVHYSDPLVTSTPFEALKSIGGGGGFAFDNSGETLYVGEGSRISVFHREPASAPSGLGQLVVDGVRTNRAIFNGQLFAGGAPTSYHFEYGTDTSYGASTPEVQAPFSHFGPVKVGGVSGGALVEGLAPDTTYHVRLVATNSVDTTYGPDKVFKTYAMPAGSIDPCPNALARKQTGTRDLPDCRAYELVSARDTGGYEVESSLVAGQTPFEGYPDVKGSVLYGVHGGAVPGPWHATNRGVDPYLANRGANGWSTNYLGLPSDINSLTGPFSSSVGEASAGLSTLAFAGTGLCKPCFSEGIETGIPVRLPGGQLVQGMAGSLDPGVPSAMPEGKVGKYFSANGQHLVFASKYAFEPGANDNSGDLTIYERDLSAGETEIVSTTAGGSTMTGAGISELDISADGSRVLFAQKVSSDSAGNEYLHPYLHLAGSQGSVDLAPTTTTGVLYDGMSADGSKVFFTSKDALLPADDTDSSADIYEADVDSAGNVSLSLVSAGNSTTCNPVANSARTHWNSVTGTADCGAVAVGGGGGVATDSGDVYFLSPEQLDGSEGTLDQPNLYLTAPGGSPVFIATLEPNNPLVLHSVSQAGAHQSADFQTNPSGSDAAFTSKLQLSPIDPTGDAQIFHYDAATDALDCASCNPTNSQSTGASGDALLAANGRSITDDGRVFFSTPIPLVLRDTGNRLDVYESSGGPAELISSGISPFDSGLLSVSSDGTDAYFFTHDRLAAAEDQNSGTVTRIYDARSNGGFFSIPGPGPCAASDECHGPGTQSAPSPPIRTGGPTIPGNEKAKAKALSCRKGQAKKRGRCVPKKKSHAKKHHATKSQSRGSH